MAVVICDLDSTLADTSHRHDLSPHTNPGVTWAEYGKQAYRDELILGTARVLSLLRQVGHEIHILSGRPSSLYEVTTRWLHKHKINFSVLRLHRSSDSDDLVAYKMNYLKQLQAKKIPVVLAIEDWPDICEAYEQMGVPSVCINPRYHDGDPMMFFRGRK